MRGFDSTLSCITVTILKLSTFSLIYRGLRKAYTQGYEWKKIQIRKEEKLVTYLFKQNEVIVRKRNRGL